MSNQVALVTGASRGIGRELARSLAGMSFDLILVARDQVKLAGHATALEQDYGIAAQAVAVDLCHFAATSAAIAAAIERMGRLDVLVNSAGIFRFGTGAMSLDDLDALLTTNVKAVHNVCRVCIDHLSRSPAPHIFNIASVAGVEPFAPVGGYAASKHGLVGYSRSLAQELISRNIKVTTLCPDVVDTDMAAASGMAPEQMIATRDISRALEFVLSLSPAALIDQMTIGCRPVAGSERAGG